jgi:hypothetical protein
LDTAAAAVEEDEERRLLFSNAIAPALLVWCAPVKEAPAAAPAAHADASCFACSGLQLLLSTADTVAFAAVLSSSRIVEEPAGAKLVVAAAFS